MKNQKTKKIKSIAIYARASTGGRGKEETIKNQTISMQKYARNNGYAIVKEYLEQC